MKWIEKPETKRTPGNPAADTVVTCWIDTCNCDGCKTNDCCNKS
ncbi:MAG: hypothetical protein PHQ23_11010 [Candidatus Wallbacteria bacterium]|nr:hypothetical protein [Candidatus Wallbacteria bacterium]